MTALSDLAGSTVCARILKSLIYLCSGFRGNLGAAQQDRTLARFARSRAARFARASSLEKHT
jgi:hypothetical protein